MCGIFAYRGKTFQERELIAFANKIDHRGPDSTQYKRINKDIFLGFHRLSINGLNEESNQPLIYDHTYLICNGEIFNYKTLIEEYNLEKEYKTNSDCEIILHLYKKVGIEKTCILLDGEFAFVLYDGKKDLLYIARDHLGIRSLYWNIEKDEICVCSELKGMIDIKHVQQFPPGSYWASDVNKVVAYYTIPTEIICDETEEEIISNIRRLFIQAVNKRMMSERTIACLLSGGLDSTTIVGIIASQYKPYELNTYSIGLKGSVDLHYAEIAASYLQTNHTSIELTNQQFLEAIEDTIYQIESYDTTTVRASVGNYLVSKYIKNMSEDTVLFCGDVSDELFGSYRGFYYAPTDVDFYIENVKMLQHIHFFDVLRSDKSIAGAGLEARVPFSDKTFVDYCMKIDPYYKKFSKDRMEKYLFRKAFEHLLPPELIWRVKTAFSDGVSHSENPWYQILKENMDLQYSDLQFEEKRKKYIHNSPYDKESLYYREIFELYYPNCEHTIPYYWKQPFLKEKDPSAWFVEKKN